MKKEELQNKLKDLRNQWREVRQKRLARKKSLLDDTMSKQKIYSDKDYKELRKDQHRLSVAIKHTEKKINRIMAVKNVQKEK